jgi:NAD(P)-dependent dehydrogenase (short-subunit alcohol dehydrogenase family)
MDLHLSGKVAVVTGASKGVGLAITRALASEGMSVAAGARDGSAELAGRSAVQPVLVNLTTADGPSRLVEQAMSKEFGPRRVRVNTVSPGPVETDLWLRDRGVAATVAQATDSQPDQVAKQAVADTSTGRFTHPQEVVDLVLVLASDRAGNITGTDVLIDGGLVKTL